MTKTSFICQLHLQLFVYWETKYLSNQHQNLIDQLLKGRSKGQRLINDQIFWINDSMKFKIEIEEKIVQKYEICTSTFKRIMKNFLYP